MTNPVEHPRLRPGDFILVDFDPVRGSEQAGRRPAIVVSAAMLHETSRRAIVCPITRNTSPWPTKVHLPDGLPVSGAVLVDQPRVIDREERVLRVLGAAPEPVLQQVRRMLAAILDIRPDGAPP